MVARNCMLAGWVGHIARLELCIVGVELCIVGVIQIIHHHKDRKINIERLTLIFLFK